MILLISAILRAHFSNSSWGFFMGRSSTALFFFLVLFFSFSTPYIVLLCKFLRMHAINSCVGDTWQRLWRDDFTHNGKQAQDPPGSLHTNVSSVEWSSLKGSGPRWFTVRKTDLLYKDVTFWLFLFLFIYFILVSCFISVYFIGNLLSSST